MNNINNRDEQVVFEYLKAQFGEKVDYEPNNNHPPDIAIGITTGIEVRRLNQNFFDTEEPEGLEEQQFRLNDVFNDVLHSLNYLYKGNSYWIFLILNDP